MQREEGDGVVAFVRTLSARTRSRIALGLLLGGTLLFCASLFFGMPASFPTETRIEIPSGVSATETAELLAERGVVRSALAFQVALSLIADETGVKAGVYWFAEPLDALGVARAVAEGTSTVPLRRLTIPEGLANTTVADLVEEQLGISRSDFLAAARGKEGYLFPETYFVADELDAEGLVALMEEEFDEVIAPLVPTIVRSGRTVEEVVIMASILEREGDAHENMRLIAGILWDRMDRGMRLQVDASFVYLLGKGSSEVTRADLELDSPYNTYRYPGLPAGPLGNPGRMSLEAAADPLFTSYVYYLTGDDGTFRYAETYDEHLENIERYLKNR